MKKKLVCLALVVFMFACISTTAFAGTASNYYSGVKVTTTCNAKSSGHSIATNTVGIAKLHYTLNGETYVAVPGVTYPGSNSWSASITILNGSAYKATTAYNVVNVVTAVYPP